MHFLFCWLQLHLVFICFSFFFFHFMEVPAVPTEQTNQIVASFTAPYLASLPSFSLVRSSSHEPASSGSDGERTSTKNLKKKKCEFCPLCIICLNKIVHLNSLPLITLILLNYPIVSLAACYYQHLRSYCGTVDRLALKECHQSVVPVVCSLFSTLHCTLPLWCTNESSHFCLLCAPHTSTCSSLQ